MTSDVYEVNANDLFLVLLVLDSVSIDWTCFRVSMPICRLLVLSNSSILPVQHLSFRLIKQSTLRTPGHSVSKRYYWSSTGFLTSASTALETNTPKIFDCTHWLGESSLTARMSTSGAASSGGEALDGQETNRSTTGGDMCYADVGSRPVFLTSSPSTYRAGLRIKWPSETPRSSAGCPRRLTME